MARLIRRAVTLLALLALAALAYLVAREYVRRHPQDVPWTQLQFDQPIGYFTARKLALLTGDARKCRALLAQAGVVDTPAPPRQDGPRCGYDDGVRLERDVDFAPGGLVTSCPVAAALLLFERQVAQPAAVRHFGVPLASIEHAGSYSCRRMYGRSEGRFSEHATADAFDILGFRLANGRRISVKSDWRDAGANGLFLREVRDGSCRLFATVLSPDYNEAHADHFHFDMAERGQMGWSLCR